MKIHGLSAKCVDTEDAVPEVIVDITPVANSDEPGRTARFLDNRADGMDARSTAWEHEDRTIKDKNITESPGFVVLNPEYTL